MRARLRVHGGAGASTVGNTNFVSYQRSHDCRVVVLCVCLRVAQGTRALRKVEAAALMFARVARRTHREAAAQPLTGARADGIQSVSWRVAMLLPLTASFYP